jgi:hypothetical protein
MVQQTSSPQQQRSGLVTIFTFAAIITVVVIVIQFSLAGLGAFHAVRSQVAGDESGYGPHKWVGLIIAILSLALLVLAIVGKLGGRIIGMTAVLLVLTGPVQPLLGNAGADSGVAWGALHALVGGLILGLTANLITAARRR